LLSAIPNIRPTPTDGAVTSNITATNLGVNLYAGIGGKVERGETPEQALVREFVEEVGGKPVEFSKIGQVGFVFLHKKPESKWNMIVDVFRITKLDGMPRKSEAIEPMWFDIENIPYNYMWPDNFYWAHLVIKNIQFVGEFVYKDADSLEQIYVKILE